MRITRKEIETYQKQFATTYSSATPLETIMLLEPEFRLALRDAYLKYIDVLYPKLLKKYLKNKTALSELIQIHVKIAHGIKKITLEERDKNALFNQLITQLENADPHIKNDILTMIEFLGTLGKLHQIHLDTCSLKSEALIAQKIAEDYPTIKEYTGVLVKDLSNCAHQDLKQFSQLPSEKLQVFVEDYKRKRQEEADTRETGQMLNRRSMVLENPTLSFFKKAIDYVKANPAKIAFGALLGAAIVLGVTFLWPVIIPAVVVTTIGTTATLVVMTALGATAGLALTRVLHYQWQHHQSPPPKYAFVIANDPDPKKDLKHPSPKVIVHSLQQQADKVKGQIPELNDGNVKVSPKIVDPKAALNMLNIYLNLGLNSIQIDEMDSDSMRNAITQFLKAHLKELGEKYKIARQKDPDESKQLAEIFVEFLSVVKLGQIYKQLRQDAFYSSKFTEAICQALSGRFKQDDAQAFMVKVNNIDVKAVAQKEINEQKNSSAECKFN